MNCINLKFRLSHSHSLIAFNYLFYQIDNATQTQNLYSVLRNFQTIVIYYDNVICTKDIVIK